MSNINDLRDAWILGNFARLSHEFRNKYYKKYSLQISDLNRSLFDLLCGKIKPEDVSDEIRSQCEKLNNLTKNDKTRKYYLKWKNQNK